jgi:hypothetical protein
MDTDNSEITEHWNIQIKVQRVQHRPIGAKVAPSIASAMAGKERDILDVLDLKVSADTMDQAYAKSIKLLEVEQMMTESHQHRASCDDAGGNHVCGFPA